MLFPQFSASSQLSSSRTRLVGVRVPWPADKGAELIIYSAVTNEIFKLS